MNARHREKSRGMWLFFAALIAAVQSLASTAAVRAQEQTGPYTELFNQVTTNWQNQKQTFNDRMAELREAGLSPEILREQSAIVLKEHMTTARSLQAKINRVYNEAARTSGVKISVGGDPASPFGRGLAGGDVDFSGTPAQAEKFFKALRELGVPEKAMKSIERTPSRVSSEGILTFTINYTPPTTQVGSEMHRQTILTGAQDIEHDLSVTMKKGQPGRTLVGVESNIKKYLKGGLDNPAVLLETPDHLQTAVKGTLKNIDLTRLTEADIKTLIRRVGWEGSPDQLTDMLQRMKSQGDALIPKELHGFDEAKMAKFQNLLKEINRAAEWKATMQAEQQARSAAELYRELASSSDPLIREQITDLRETVIDSHLRIKASIEANHTKTREALWNEHNIKVQRFEDLRRQGPSVELDKAIEDLSKIRTRINAESAEQAHVRERIEARLKSVLGESASGEQAGSTSEYLNRVKGGFFSTEVRPGFEVANNYVSKGMAAVAGLDAFEQAQEAGHGVTYSAATGLVTTGAMLTPVSVVYFAPATAWDQAKATADELLIREVENCRKLGVDLTPERLNRLAKMAQIKGTLVGTVYGTATVATITPAVFVGNAWAAYAGPAGVAFLSVTHAYSKWRDYWAEVEYYDSFSKFNDAEQLSQLREALAYGRAALTALTAQAAVIRRELDSFQSLATMATSAEGLYDFYSKQYSDQFGYLEQVGARVEEIRKALARGTLDPSAADKVSAEFNAVKAACDEISKQVDELIAGYEAKTIRIETLRERYVRLVEQFNVAQDRYAAARRTYEDFRLLARQREFAEEYATIRKNAETVLSEAGTQGKQLEMMAKEAFQHVRLLEKQSDEFRSRKATSTRGLRHFAMTEKMAAAEEKEIYGLIDGIIALDIPNFRPGDLNVPANELRQHAAPLRLLSEKPLPPAVSFEGLDRYSAAADSAVLALTPIASDALVSLEQARKQLQRLSELLQMAPPAFALATKSVGEKTVQFEFTASRLPLGKKKLVINWNFGDGTSDVSDERVRQHEYARNGRYEVNVTVYEATEKVSLKIGEASLVVNIGTSETTTPVVAGTPPDESQPHFVMIAVLSPDFDRQGNRVLKDRSGSPPFIAFRVYPASGKVTADFGVRRGFYFEKSGVYEPFYHLTVDGAAEALLEPRSNRIEFATAPLKWEQQVGVYSLGGRVTQEKYGLADAYKRTGVDPTGLRWTGRISGELDWRSGRIGATTGRLEVNALISGDWKIAAVDGLNIGGGRGQWMSPSAVRFYWFRLHPDVASAKQVIQASKLAWMIEPFPHDPAHEVFQNNQDALVRIGRWTAKWLKPGPGKQQQYEQLVKFINGPGRQLEQAVPGTADE